MGSSNKTCALTNLPIFHGERVYVFVLHEKEDDYGRDRACYSNYLYKPLLLPFESDYDDYGGGENSGGYAFPIVMNALKRKLIEKEVGKDDYSEMEIKRDGFNEELFFKSVWANRLEVNTYYGPKKVKFVMMRKDVVDSILERWVIEEFVDYDYNLNKGVYRKYTFQDVLNDVEPYLAKREQKYKDENLVSRKFRFLEQNCHNTILIPDLELSNLLFHGKFSEAKPFIETLLKGVFVHEFMESTRRCWVPPCGEGSQDNDHDPYELLSNVILERIESHKKEMEEW